MANQFSFRNMSIQKRLPLFIFLILVAVLLVFSITSYIGVRSAALVAGKERVKSLTGQLASMFQQSTQSQMTSVKNASRKEPVRQFLLTNAKDSVAAANEILKALTQDSSSIAAILMDTNFNAKLSTFKTPALLQVSLDALLSSIAASADTGRIGKIHLINDSLYFPVIVKVSHNRETIGYLVRWRRVLSSQRSIDQLSGLIGSKAALYIGNNDGKLWTNMITRVENPPIKSLGRDSVLEYNSGEGAVLASIRPIPNTSWLVLIEFKRQAILAVANSFLYRILIIGIILVALGVFVAWIIGRSISRPLENLTQAASAIAEGDYTQAVQSNRGDELGKLAHVFNTMAVKVRNAQHDLEDKVQERTTQLETMKRAAEKANESKTRFLSSMSHEIRTPLNGILGFTEILSKDSLTKEQQQEYLGHIKTAGQLLLKLIGDILDLNKIEEGKFSFENESFHLREFVESSIHPYKYRINENGIDFRMEIRPDIPDYIISDRHRINQLLVNLIGNSLKFTKGGVIGIIIDGEKINEESFMLRMSVYDTGIGIASDKFEKIFESFSQGSDSINRHYGGSGLGLAIVRQLVTAMHGSIKVTSPSPYRHEKGEAGSCFEIQLPVRIDNTRTLASAPSKSVARQENFHGKNVSILVVDDNVMNKKLAGFILEKLGCEVHVAGNGQEAIDMVKVGKFNVVLMDVHMPVMDGYEASLAIRNQLKSEIPIIGVTANVFKEDVEKCLEAGMNDHLGKPYQEDQLLGKLSRWI